MSKIEISATRFYVVLMRVLAMVLRWIGVLGWLERRLDRRGAHWFRSLFAIHDVDQLVQLDVPWWTYRSIDKVDAFLKSRTNASVFEYGSGASSVWLARRAASVYSVEHDQDWFEFMKSRTAGLSGLSILHIPVDAVPSVDGSYSSRRRGYEGKSFKAYAHAIGASDRKYDLIVIDGRARVACFQVAKSHLAADGMIVFDNSKRKRYAAAFQTGDFTATAFSGLTPTLIYPEQTTLLTRKGVEAG